MLYMGVILSRLKAALESTDLWTIRLSMKTANGLESNLYESYSRKDTNCSVLIDLGLSM